jgi:hypothetical protein
MLPQQRLIHHSQDHLDMLLHYVHVGAFLSRSRQRFDVVQGFDRIDPATTYRSFKTPARSIHARSRPGTSHSRKHPNPATPAIKPQTRSIHEGQESSL